MSVPPSWHKRATAKKLKKWPKRTTMHFFTCTAARTMRTPKSQKIVQYYIFSPHGYKKYKIIERITITTCPPFNLPIVNSEKNITRAKLPHSDTNYKSSHLRFSMNLELGNPNYCVFQNAS